MHLCGASGAALLATSLFATSDALACTATPVTRGGLPTVDIVCNTGDADVQPFATSYGGVVNSGTGIDTLTINGGSVVVTGLTTPPVQGTPFDLDPSAGVISMGDGDDIVIMRGGAIGTAAAPLGLDLGAGADRFTMSGGTISGSVFGLGGGNTYTVSGGRIDGSIFAGSQDDTVNISGAAFIHGNFDIGPDAVGLEDGDDTFTMTGGTLVGAVSGGNGDDLIFISGGSVGSVDAGAGDNDVVISGGTVVGNVNADHLTLTGGTIGGDITGISENTLFIDDAASPAPIVLTNGATISGIGAGGNAQIFNTDLGAGGAKTLVFSNFQSVSLDNSTLGFGTGAQGIGLLALANGSTLYAFGNVNMGGGNVTVTNSTLTMLNGIAGNTFTVGGITFSNGTLGLDVNQRTLQADQVVANTFGGTGVFNIALIGTPVFSQPTDIPIVTTTGGPITGSFTAQGLPGSQASLFTYQVLPGGAGGFVLRITPANFGLALTPQNALDVSTIQTALDALDGINDDAIEYVLGLANGAKRIQIADNFGVFASGQFAHTEHDGFEVTSGPLTADGPSFDANDFSAAISIDFDAARHFGFDKEYGLNLGLFGGYASTDVQLDSLLGFDVVGDANNKSGMFGAYGLLRREYTYALLSGIAFLGESEVSNGFLASDGDYSTEGYAITGSVGHIFALSDDVRFDARGGLLGVAFNGGDYADSNNNQFGGSQISFGAIKLEPGIYMDRPLENGMIFSPYARAELQQRFGYSNTATIDTREVSFDDADFSAALSTGFNLKMSKTATMSSEVRGKLSSDSWTVAGKIGLKVAF